MLAENPTRSQTFMTAATSLTQREELETAQRKHQPGFSTPERPAAGESALMSKELICVPTALRQGMEDHSLLSRVPQSPITQLASGSATPRVPSHDPSCTDGNQ